MHAATGMPGAEVLGIAQRACLLALQRTGFHAGDTGDVQVRKLAWTVLECSVQLLMHANLNGCVSRHFSYCVTMTFCQLLTAFRGPRCHPLLQQVTVRAADMAGAIAKHKAFVKAATLAE